MAATRTFSIIKPDATRRNLTGAVTKMLEDAGLRVVASKRIRMTRDQAEGFYAVHRERPFFNDLCTFMTSGPVVVQVLEGENAVAAQPRSHGRDQPRAGRRGHDPQDLCGIDRGQFGPRLGQRRERQDRDRLLLQAATKSSASQSGHKIGLSVASRFCHSRRRDAEALDVLPRHAVAVGEIVVLPRAHGCREAASANRMLFSKLSSKLRRSRLARADQPDLTVDDHRLGVEQAAAIFEESRRRRRSGPGSSFGWCAATIRCCRCAWATPGSCRTPRRAAEVSANSTCSSGTK